MHVSKKISSHFRTVYTVVSANRFCNVNHTINTE